MQPISHPIETPRLSEPARAAEPATVCFWLLIVAHAMIWTLVCVFTQPNPPLDMVEMLYWGQQWQLGYHKHPPLPAWIAAGTWELAGGQPWALYLVCQLTVVATFWAVWQLAREFLSPWHALCAVAVLQGCYYFNFLNNDINNTILLRPFWALAVLFMYRAITGNRMVDWCWTGMCFALGMLCKYNMAILIISMMMIPLVIPKTRRLLLGPGPWLMTAVAAGLFLPHVIWVFQNDFVTIDYVLQRSNSSHSGWASHMVNPVGFLISQLGAVLPIALLSWPLIRGRKRPPGTTTQTAPYQYLQLVVVLPIVLYLVVSLALGVQLRSMWGGPLFSFLGLLLLVWFQPREDRALIRGVLRTCLLIGLLMALGLAGRNCLGPALRDKPSRVHFPGEELSRQVCSCWDGRFETPLPVIGGPFHLAANIGIHPDRPIPVYGDMDPIVSPWMDDRQFRASGGIIVWDIDRHGPEFPGKYQYRFDAIELCPPVTCRYQTMTDIRPARVGVAIVRPRHAPAETRQARGTESTNSLR